MSRSLINTSLFINSDDHDNLNTSDTFSTDGNDGTSGSESIIDHEDVASYEKISDEEDLYIIRTKGKSHYLYRQRLIDTVTELHDYAHVQISQLEKPQAKLLSSTIEATRILYNSNVLKILILDDIQRIFSDIKNPTPGSVSAFFLACFNNDDFNGPLGCNPRCAASSLKCDTFECSDNILVYSNHEFNSLNDKQTSHAYIYIESPTFVTFQPHEVQMLRDANISTVTLIYGNANGTYLEVTNKMSIHDLPLSQNTTTASTGTILVIIILVILIILGLLFVYGKGYMI